MATAELSRSSCTIGGGIGWRILFVLPSIVCIFAVIVFPFFYNIVLSLSNMSLANFRDWQVVGLQNYVEVFTDPKIWGGVFEDDRVDGGQCCVSCRVGRAAGGRAQRAGAREIDLSHSADHSLGSAGVYYGALWRGMFDYEYGAVNLMLTQIARFPPAAWLLTCCI